MYLRQISSYLNLGSQSSPKTSETSSLTDNRAYSTKSYPQALCPSQSPYPNQSPRPKEILRVDAPRCELNEHQDFKVLPSTIPSPKSVGRRPPLGDRPKENITQPPPNSFAPELPQIAVTPPFGILRKPVPQKHRNPAPGQLDLASINPNSGLQKIFNVDSDAGLISSRLTGLQVPKILGIGKKYPRHLPHCYLPVHRTNISLIAPSLENYHTLWRFRYTLEIQLCHGKSDFQHRFYWTGLKDLHIATPPLDVKVQVIKELIYILKLTKAVLVKVYDERPADCRNCRDFITNELVGLKSDIRTYEKSLAAYKLVL